MIAFLSGKLLEKEANLVIIDVGGVGYEVIIPLSTFYARIAIFAVCSSVSNLSNACHKSAP
jgi:Holliday junction resolvasome RuvABC DNA-binding subunit